MSHKPAASCVSVHRHLWAVPFFEVLPAGTCLFLTQPRKTRRGHLQTWVNVPAPPLPGGSSLVVTPVETGITDENNGFLPDLSSWTGLVGGAQACLPDGSSPAASPALWSLTWHWIGSALSHPWPVPSGQSPDLFSFVLCFPHRVRNSK